MRTVVVSGAAAGGNWSCREILWNAGLVHEGRMDFDKGLDNTLCESWAVTFAVRKAFTRALALLVEYIEMNNQHYTAPQIQPSPRQHNPKSIQSPLSHNENTLNKGRRLTIC